MDIICYKCGASSKNKKFVDLICIDCYKKEKLEKIPNEISVKRCKICGKYKISNWSNLRNQILNKFSKFNCENLEFFNDFVRIHFFDKIEFCKDIKLKIEETYCDFCGKIKRKYYEAIVQIRGEKSNIIKDEIIEKLKNFIVKIDEVKNGFDIYSMSTKETSAVLSKLGYKPKISKKLYGKVGGKNVYRTTFLVRS